MKRDKRNKPLFIVAVDLSHEPETTWLKALKIAQLPETRLQLLRTHFAQTTMVRRVPYVAPTPPTKSTYDIALKYATRHERWSWLTDRLRGWLSR
jgi:hypothetical protein